MLLGLGHGCRTLEGHVLLIILAMTLLADSSSTPKKPWKRCLRSNFKHPKLDAVRRFPANCGAPPPTDIIRPESNAVANSPIDCPAIACCNSPSNIKRPKVDVARNSPEHCGPFAYGINGGESEFPVDGKKYAVAIPAVPLRSVPLINSENSVLSDAKDGDVGKIMAKENENKLRSQEESWRHDSEKLAEVIAEAKNYINGFDVRYSSSKQVLASEDYQPPSLEYAVLDKHNSIGEPKPLKQEKRAGEINLAESVMQQNLDESRSEKRMKVEYRVSKVVQEKKASGLESKCEGNEEEVCVLSPEEWRTLPLCVRHKRNLTNCDSNATAMYSDISIKTDVNGNNEPKYDDDRKDLINLSIVQHEQPRRKVMEALKLFDDHYTELVKKSKAEPRGERKGTKYPHLEAAERLKDAGMYISIEKHFGHIPGVEIGDEFRFRTELALVGLHRQLIAGIDHVVLDGKKYATSVVDSGRYENEAKTLDVLIYSGQGWIKKNADNSIDQKPEKGNLALMNSMEMGYPVRVIFKRSLAASKVYTSNERNFVYVYDGLYTVNNFWQEKDRIGKLVFKFELHRMPGQPRPHQTDAKSRKSGECDEVCMVDDLSQGKEKMPIRAMNGVDDARPPPFTYVTDIVYPHWYQQIDPIGCNCKNGCSDSRKCPCVLKNGDEIPFNENGAIIKAKPKGRVHECGPSCKCPPTCMNRVTQHGPKYQLEIFKTELRGWGVRSRDYISSGSFVCEYVGEFLQENEAELRIGDDEYLFDICKERFAIDAAICGNIGRFINHSCSPNMYAQEVLYDHDDKRMPHIMFFATKDIPPLKELFYDYNYKLGQVCDANGNIVTKECHCGSSKCSGRMY